MIDAYHRSAFCSHTGRHATRGFVISKIIGVSRHGSPAPAVYPRAEWPRCAILTRSPPLPKSEWPAAGWIPTTGPGRHRESRIEAPPSMSRHRSPSSRIPRELEPIGLPALDHAVLAALIAKARARNPRRLQFHYGARQWSADAGCTIEELDAATARLRDQDLIRLRRPGHPATDTERAKASVWQIRPGEILRRRARFIKPRRIPPPPGWNLTATGEVHDPRPVVVTRATKHVDTAWTPRPPTPHPDSYTEAGAGMTDRVMSRPLSPTRSAAPR